MSQQGRQVDTVKVPPHSLEAEQSVLGGIMLDAHVWDKVCDRIQSNDFYYPGHRTIFQAMQALLNRDKPLDVITLVDWLREQSKLEEVGDDTYLYELARNTPSVSNVVAYADIIRERSVLRQLIDVANAIASRAYSPEGMDTVQILDEAERNVFSIAESSPSVSGPVNIKSVLTSTVDRIDQLYHSTDSVTGLPTGYTDLDQMTSGLQPADLVILAARPSMGKTSFAMNVAEHAAIKSQKPVLVFSLEMPAESLAMRMLSSLSRIDQHKIRTGNLQDDDWSRITSSIAMLSQAPMFIDDTPGLSPAEMRARARRIAKENGEIGLILVDYLQLMQMPGQSENRTLEVSEISRALKGLAKELNVPVIALSQLNRSLEQRSDKRPVMSDLRESGAIEQDADVITFIYRDEVYNEDSADMGTAEIIIAKQRNGPIGKVRLTFQGQYTRFENFTEDSWAQ